MDLAAAVDAAASLVLTQDEAGRLQEAGILVLRDFVPVRVSATQRVGLPGPLRALRGAHAGVPALRQPRVAAAVPARGLGAGAPLSAAGATRSSR